MSSSDDSIRSARPLDLEGLIEQGLRQKVIYAGAEPTGQPYLIVTEDGIALVGDDSNVISLNPDFDHLRPFAGLFWPACPSRSRSAAATGESTLWCCPVSRRPALLRCPG